MRFLLTMLAALSLAFLPTAAVAQVNPTKRVPLCLQFPDRNTMVPCTGVVPTDANGNPINWEDLFKGGESGGVVTQTVITVSAAQAAGTAPLMLANTKRVGLQFGGSVDFKIATVASATDGLRVYASARDELSGKSCPTGAIYLVSGSGITTGATIVIWESL